MNITGNTKILALFGNPVTHTKSPELHNKWIIENNIDYVYIPFEVSDINGAVKSIKSLNISGVNVTVPYKENVMPLLDELSEEARAIGAVNTIVNTNGTLKGFNTDALGFYRSIEPFLKENSTVLILGAGGASKAICYALKEYYPKKLNLMITNRTHEKAIELADLFHIEAIELSELNHKTYDSIINTTSVGLNKSESILEIKALKKHPTFVYDLIYNPEQTQLIKEANRLGIETKNGYEMLVNQARESFRLWTGIG